MTATEDTPLRAGFRWLASKRVTLGVVSLLLAVFGFELLVWLAYGVEGWQYFFLANLDPTPGWVMAPFAHRNPSHLLTTLVVIVVYGGLVETVLPDHRFLAFYVFAGYASTLAQLAAYLGGAPGLGTLGASGAALGLVALYVVRMGGRAIWAPATVTVVDGVFTGSGLVIVATVLANDFVPGVVFASGTAPLGHVGGLLAGVAGGVAVLLAERKSSPDPSLGT
ncbi:MULTISPECIES: rhomboid family intramembrane serine protease [Salinibaculum]|uniref:rhomboid family intramembrane serine protease n=1 Tax=Salinibaculum TaxID=2732368 RepID=UPI0030CEFB3A